MVSLWGIFKVHYWPLLTLIWFVITFAASYAVTVDLDHIYWLFPYISDTGDFPPESCVFAELLNIGIIFLSVTIYLRHREIEAAINAGLINTTAILNTVCLWLGWLICLGLTFVANFQLNAAYVSDLHIFAALVSFVIGAVYCLLQTVISWKYVIIKRDVTTATFKLGLITFSIRVFLVVSFLPAFITYKVCAEKAEERRDALGNSMKHWTSKDGVLNYILPKHYFPEDGGYEYHVVSAFAQWTVVVILLLYIATFTKEFKNMRFREIRFEFIYSQGQV